MKAFVAVIPPLHIREAIAKFRHVSQPVDKMHVTVHFIGTVTKKSLRVLSDKFLSIESNAICSIIYNAGAFNNLDGSAHFCIGPRPEWVDMHEKVATTFGHRVFKKYSPHLTVATFKGSPVPTEVVASLSAEGLNKQFLFNADKISLLTSEKGVYKIVNTVFLRKR